MKPNLRFRALSKIPVIVLVAFGLVSSGAATAGDLYVIAHVGTHIVEGDVRSIFTGEKQLADGTKLVPVDNVAIQADMTAKVLNMDVNRYNSVWTKKSFREGLNPPSVKSSDIEVIEFVKKTAGAVGYVGTAPSAGVTLVKKY